MNNKDLPRALHSLSEAHMTDEQKKTIVAIKKTIVAIANLVAQ